MRSVGVFVGGVLHVALLGLALCALTAAIVGVASMCVVQAVIECVCALIRL